MEDHKSDQRTRAESLLSRITLFGGSMTASYLSGLTFGAAGRLTGSDIIPLAPPLIEVVSKGGINPNQLPNYILYGAGVITTYADKIVQEL